MKTSRPWFILFLVALFWPQAGVVRCTYVDEDVSLDQFHQALDNYGQWVAAGQYGQAWHPTDVEDDWAPYTDGQWAYTDDGWTWMGAEPWADPVSHYGRWTYVDGLGWCWVPGYDWAPAWVSWRDAGDYVGWAPLPPEADWDPEEGLGIWVDSSYGIGPGFYHFMHKHNLGERNVRGALLPTRHNLAFMLATSNVTHLFLNKSDGRVFVGGPNFAAVSQVTTSAIPQYHVVSDASVKQSSVVGNDLHVPALAAKSLAATAPATPHQTRAPRHAYTPRVAASHGWRGVADASSVGLFERMVVQQANGLTPQTAPVRPRRGEAIAAMGSQRLSSGVSMFQRPAAQPPPPQETGFAPAPANAPPERGSYGRMDALPPSPVVRAPLAPSLAPRAPWTRPSPSLGSPERRMESGGRTSSRTFGH